MAFRVGQRVVCVDASVKRFFKPGEALVEGRVYTIAEMFDCPFDGTPVLGLREQPRALLHRLKVGYRASRFRPVQKRKTSIECFTALLNTKSVEELV